LCVVVGAAGSTGASRSNRIERTAVMGYSDGRCSP
jgi:hypothetical protein